MRTREDRTLVLKVAELTVENRQLRRRLEGERYHVSRVEQAYKDALQLSLWRAAGIHPSRRFAALYGVSQQRWDNALALLRMARIVSASRRWATNDAAVIENRLFLAKKRAIDGVLFFKARHVRDRHK